LEVLEEPEMAECPSESVTIVDLAEDRQALVQQYARFGVARLDERLSSEAVEQRGKQAAIVKLARDRQPFPEQRSAGRVVRERSRQVPRATQGAGQSGDRRHLPG